MSTSIRSIALYNTLTRKKETFVPRVVGQVSFYVCGVTVYDFSHLGHARAYVAFDCMRRYLQHCGYTVRFVQNFTDIDDKIIARAKENNESCDDLTLRFIDAYFQDMTALNVLPASLYPKATLYVDKMIHLIEGLIQKGAAYVSDSGDVCFSVEQFPDYGKLSKKILDELEVGTRVEVDSSKKSPMDFVLWKKAKPGEPVWDSPWGPGRPGWHIECSAMAIEELGESIDIHAGGEDLIFPHHENEIAQSECFTGKQFAKYWLHNGFVTIRNEKMSKSLKNFFTIRDVLKDWEGEVIRFFLLKVHYRSPVQFSYEGLEEAKQALTRLRNTLLTVPVTAPSAEYKSEFDALVAKFYEAMSDDFNYAEALGFLFEISKLIHVSQSGGAVLKELGQLLGLFYSGLEEASLSDEAQQLIDQRSDAKKAKDFGKADALRNELLTRFGIELKDTPQGVQWRRV